MVMRRLAFRFVLVALALVLGGGVGNGQATPPGGRRVALIVGNGAYRSVDRLTNPANDARLMAQTLRASGFTLVGDGPQMDLNKAAFDRVVQAFGQALQGADVALFYYSGHGMQVGGTNWLVPVDASPAGARDLDFQGVDANLVLRQMEGAGTRLNLVILDACRNNPFASRGIRSSGGGLAEMRAPEGTVISYSTQPGNVAADGNGANSPYTAALAEAIRRPGLDVFQVFNQVGLSVKTATANQQQPWFASSPITGNFYFLGPVTIQPPGEEAVFWQSVAQSRNPADLQAYLRRYPQGTFADLARSRLAALAPPAPAAPVTATLGRGPASRFDGAWGVNVVCPAFSDAAAVDIQMNGTVQGGVLRAERFAQGKPGWLLFEGAIQPDGSATLNAQGLTGNQRFSLNGVQPGTPYTYQIAARFESARGAGDRVGGRPCSAAFVRR